MLLHLILFLIKALNADLLNGNKHDEKNRFFYRKEQLENILDIKLNANTPVS